MQRPSSAAGADRPPVDLTSSVPATPLRFIKPTLPAWEKVASAYRSVYETGVITNGSLVERFEAAVAERLGVKHCVAVSSCTSGLILTLKAMNLRGEVIVPSFTFFATGEALLWNGLRPIFADCSPDTWNIDSADVARRITPRTAAILAVHMYGNPADTEQLSRIAAKSDVKLIFDAAHAFGSLREGIPVGSFGDAEVFSLSPTKLLVAGEGGLVTTNDAVLARRLRAARNYGDTGSYNPEILGLNARMSEFNAALGIAGLDLVEKKVRRHNQIARLYTELLRDLPGVRFQCIREDDLSTCKDYSIHVTSKTGKSLAERLCASLQRRNIPTKRYFYPPLHEQKIFTGIHTMRDLPLSVTESVSEGVVSLPIYESLSDEDVVNIAKHVAEVIRGLNLHEVHA